MKYLNVNAVRHMSGLIFRVYMLGPIFNIIKPTFDNSQQLTPTEDALSLTKLQC